MPEWAEKVESERDALEDLADSDLPCAEIAETLLEAAADDEREVVTSHP